ncbi:ABC transporter permease subunit [Fervidobacterium sp. 2310opik-2]|uniref:ABC transporter permease subunit n=1 Tax=Fervidobacterium sp. 2310opik-2 TaxID=1755815 RepID=UPI0013E037E4|nr:ABC transporter permease subunit [Fervidobacterium sp. 2310opik-2]KAF2961694.1 ABC transporter permease [Fervidobacterium sp. 2310opik-2]
MVKKERKLLTHIILIIVSILVLFPIVWVVSTSLRRDNAAFSTKLFSNRLTLQNYRDLIAPEKNGPRLVSDIDALVLMAPPHDKDTLEKANEYFKKDIELFKKYIVETETLKKTIDTNIETLRKYFEENSDTLVKMFNSDIDKIIKELDFQKPSRYLEVAAYDLYTNQYDVSLLDGVDYLKGEAQWNSLIGERKTKIDDLKNQIQLLENEVSSLEKNYRVYQSQYLATLKTINSYLIPQLKEYTLSLESAKNILNAAEKSQIYSSLTPDESEVRFKFENMFAEINNLRVNSQKFQDLVELDNSLKQFQKIYDEIISRWDNFEHKDKAPFADFLNTIDMFSTRVAGTVKETRTLIEKLNNITSKLLELQAKINPAKKTISDFQAKINQLNQEIEKAYETISEAKIYLKAQIVKKQLEETKQRVQNLKLPAQLQIMNLQSKKVFGITSDIVNDLTDGKKKNTLKKIILTIDWPGIAKDMFTNYDIFSENYNSFINDLKLYLSDVEIQGPKFMPAAKAGIKVRPQSLERLTDTVLSTYRTNVVPNMNVMSRKASELSDKLKIKDTEKLLKALDGAAFRIDQIWQRKPDHYMLRWILNSVIVALSVAIITTAVTALAAYPFSRMRFKGRKYGIMSLLLIQMFPAIMYMIAIYSFLAFAGKYVPGFGLNKLSGLIFAYLGGIAYNMYLIKGYYDTIPDSLEEAALIDGATRWQTFIKIVLPLASPILAVIVILTFMGTFNEFVLARIILQDVKQYTYAIGLYTFSTGPFETQWGLFTAAALIGMIPMVTLFLLMQKYIVGGLVKGAVKG